MRGCLHQQSRRGNTSVAARIFGFEWSTAWFASACVPGRADRDWFGWPRKDCFQGQHESGRGAWARIPDEER